MVYLMYIMRLRYHVRRPQLTIATIAIAVGVIAIGSIWQIVFAAVTESSLFSLNTLSPTPGQFLDIGNKDSAGFTNLTSGNAISGVPHVVRNNDAGENSTLNLRVYGNPGATTTTITFNVTNCKFETLARDNKEELGASQRRLQVNIGGNLLYNRRADRENNGTADNPKWADVDKARPCAGDTRLDGQTWTMGFTNTDPGSGKPYVDITVQLTGPPVGGANQIWFTVNATSSTIGYRGGGSTPTGKDYGFSLGKIPYERGSKAVIPFGLPCDARNDQINQPIVIHDPEQTRGGQYLKVYKRDPKTGVGGFMPNSAFTGLIRASYDGTDRVRITATDNETSTMRLTLEREYQYAVVFLNPYNDGMAGGDSGRPTGNTLSISVPQDTIYGTLNCSYSLNPNIKLDQQYFTYKTVLPAEGWVSKADESSVVTGTHKWQVSRAVFKGNPNRNGANSSGESPCTFMNGQRGAAEIASACEKVGGTDNSPAPAWKQVDDPWDTSDVEIGQYVCYMTSVQNPTSATNDDSDWRHSDIKCAISGKQPKVHVTGHDLRVGGNIDTSTTVIDNKLYSSWGEYGVFADGCNSGGRMTSGAVNNSGGTSGTMTSVTYHPLTFANTNINASCSDGVGTYGGLPDSDIELYKQGSLDSDSSENFTDVKEINAQTFASGTKKVYYFPQATVNIKGNLTYSGSYTAINQIPRVIIIAKNIVINENVDQIDAWLLAKEKISTCKTQPGSADDAGNFTYVNPLDSSKCSKKLTINGPVIASNVYLLRTYGSGKDEEAEAAETFNLRADAFLSTYSGTLGQPVATTDDIDELPPRF